MVGKKGMVDGTGMEVIVMGMLEDVVVAPGIDSWMHILTSCHCAHLRGSCFLEIVYAKDLVLLFVFVSLARGDRYR